MSQQSILKTADEFIKKNFSSEGTVHNLIRVERVVNHAKIIAKEENSDLFLVELAARLHDLGDYKLNDGKDKSEELITEFLGTWEQFNHPNFKVVEFDHFKTQAGKLNKRTIQQKSVLKNMDRNNLLK